MKTMNELRDEIINDNKGEKIKIQTAEGLLVGILIKSSDEGIKIAQGPAADYAFTVAHSDVISISYENEKECHFH